MTHFLLLSRKKVKSWLPASKLRKPKCSGKPLGWHNHSHHFVPPLPPFRCSLAWFASNGSLSEKRQTFALSQKVLQILISKLLICQLSSLQSFESDVSFVMNFPSLTPNTAIKKNAMWQLFLSSFEWETKQHQFTQTRRIFNTENL